MKGLKKLDYSFYRRPDVLEIARELLGKILVTHFDSLFTSGRIVETEAYAGVVDRASHAYGGRRTKRTEIMYAKGGTAYIYLCYGIHHLFNVVTNQENIPHAILIRSLEPLEGIETMLRRTGKKRADGTLTKGPGNLSKAMGLHTGLSGAPLTGNEIYLASDGFPVTNRDILATKRIGVEYAAEDAGLPYRFALKGNKYLSGGKNTA